jgi:hypothetical protein
METIKNYFMVTANTQETGEDGHSNEQVAMFTDGVEKLQGGGELLLQRIPNEFNNQQQNNKLLAATGGQEEVKQENVNEQQEEDDDDQYDEMILIDHGRVQFDKAKTESLPPVIPALPSSTSPSPFQQQSTASLSPNNFFAIANNSNNNFMNYPVEQQQIIVGMDDEEILFEGGNLSAVVIQGGVKGKHQQLQQQQQLIHSSYNNSENTDYQKLFAQKQRVEEHLNRCQEQITNGRAKVLQELWNELDREEQKVFDGIPSILLFCELLLEVKSME